VSRTLWGTAARLFAQICRTLHDRGEVVIKVADLKGRDGLTDFTSGVVYLDHRLTVAGARAALFHEFEHLRAGPPGAAHAAREEHRVRRATARTLLPSVHVLRAIDRPWSAADLDVLARRYGVDQPTVGDAIELTGPIPVVRIPEESVA
jgi:hypothetical protein